MENRLSEENCLDVDMTLYALTVEVSRLERLARMMNTADRIVLKDCSLRINQLILDMLSEPKLSAS